MPGISRNSGVDVASGPIISGSPNVYANNAPVARIGDSVVFGIVMISGSGKVYANNIGVCKQGDVDSLGTPVSGSSNVFAG
jgi:uncharacterized Zn-binding protein involved in type VI secretion